MPGRLGRRDALCRATGRLPTSRQHQHQKSKQTSQAAKRQPRNGNWGKYDPHLFTLPAHGGLRGIPAVATNHWRYRNSRKVGQPRRIGT